MMMKYFDFRTYVLNSRRDRSMWSRQRTKKGALLLWFWVSSGIFWDAQICYVHIHKTITLFIYIIFYSYMIWPMQTCLWLSRQSQQYHWLRQGLASESISSGWNNRACLICRNWNSFDFPLGDKVWGPRLNEEHTLSREGQVNLFCQFEFEYWIWLQVPLC